MWSYFAFTEFSAIFIQFLLIFVKAESMNMVIIFFKTVSVYSYVLKHWKLDVD